MKECYKCLQKNQLLKKGLINIFYKVREGEAIEEYELFIIFINGTIKKYNVAQLFFV